MSIIMEYLQYPFVRYAFIAGSLIALCSSLLGVTLVLKRLSLIGDGLSRAAFASGITASVLGLSHNMFLSLPVTVICSMVLMRSGKKGKLSGDSAIAILSSFALALGYMIINMFSTSANVSGDVCGALFGSTSILTLKVSDVWMSVGLSVLVVLIFVLFYDKIFAVTFDEDFAKASGMKTDLYNTIIAVTIAVVITLAVNLVGSLLISALLIFPSLAGMRIFKSFKAVTIFSAIFGVICAVTGIAVSILLGTPVGSTIVAVDALGFAVCYLAGVIKKG